MAALINRGAQEEDDDEEPNENVFIAFGIDKVEEVQRALEQRVQEAMKNGLSKNGGTVFG